MTKRASESAAKKVNQTNVRRAQATGKRQARKGARAVATKPTAPDTRFDARRWSRAFAIGLGALGVMALVVIGGQNAPSWLAAAAATPTQDSSAALAAAPDSNRIGIVSGHRGNDSGTVCADGLTEAQVNFDHAVRVAEFLRAQGYTVDILDEFDARLKGYRARALLSIHADSCTYINDLATGFKVARALESPAPEIEDELVACLTSRYKQQTGLRFHANTVTFDMTKYHAFYEIAPDTPAAIIETGFLYLDRPLLTRRPERVAQGIFDGLQCFLRGESP
jgi:N-acetylmuramoyl-L-alanine amidase